MRAGLRRPRALRMTRETPELNAELATAQVFSRLLPDTSQKHLGLYNDDTPEDSREAALRNHLMVRGTTRGSSAATVPAPAAARRACYAPWPQSPRRTCDRSFTKRPSASAKSPPSWRTTAWPSSPHSRPERGRVQVVHLVRRPLDHGPGGARRTTTTQPSALPSTAR
ncbi:MAG: hypothetical protein CM1200mP29_06010 [Verrucomicrobiota bacterium]|nr:MAG: hypothetical protein CM1200mP29_06010 [Verrucomicrobiota bacterium]